VAVLPSLGGGAKRLFLTETGSSREGVRPQIKETARLLLLIYLGLTVAQIAALKIAGMGWLDAFVHTFTSLASGGFSNYDASVGRFNNAAYDWIIILFMILGTVNFGLYYEAVRGRFRVILKDPEIRLYLIILASAGVLAWLLILPHPIVTTTGQEAAPGPLGTLRHALFNTVSVQTTTGYATVDFDRWPTLALGIIILVPFVGGCAGSTAGGIKVIRIWIAVKVLLAEIERAFRPNVVRPLRVGSAILDDSAKLSTLAYILGIVAIVLIGSAGLLVFERDKDVGFTTAFTATSACLFTTGPGLARVGPVTNYAWMSDLSKMWLTCVMFIGRLEVLTIIVLLSPRFWRESY
jgi:trk system potassium uptake protein TrkH